MGHFEFFLLGVKLIKSIPSTRSFLFYIKLKIIAKFGSHFVTGEFELLLKIITKKLIMEKVY